MDLLEKAIDIAFEVFGESEPFEHSMIVCSLARRSAQTRKYIVGIVGILHDVVEDSDWTLEDLQREGFSEEIVEAIDAISRREGEIYTEFIKRISKNKLATTVKLADLIHNLSRTGKPSLIPRYRKAFEFLNSLEN